MDALTLLRVSRPRFWLYLAGTFLLGVAAALPSVTAFISPFVIIGFILFLLPANLFLYGINDLSDGDTDKYNKKKGTKEHLLRVQQVRTLQLWVWACAFVLVAAAGILALQGLWVASLLVLLFLALGAGYSAPPVRLKARPFLDSASNILYALPGLTGYALFQNQFPQWQLILAYACWTAAMHLFSAIPDIVADRKARLQTTATVLGQYQSLLACSALWLVFAVLIITRTSAGWLFAPVFLYPAIPLALVSSSPSRIEQVYWWFPVVTGVLGMVAFWYILVKRFGLVGLITSIY